MTQNPDNIPVINFTVGYRDDYGENNVAAVIVRHDRPTPSPSEVIAMVESVYANPTDNPLRVVDIRDGNAPEEQVGIYLRGPNGCGWDRVAPLPGKKVYADDPAVYQAVKELIPTAEYWQTGGGVMVTVAHTPLGLFDVALGMDCGPTVYSNGSFWTEDGRDYGEFLSDDELESGWDEDQRVSDLIWQDGPVVPAEIAAAFKAAYDEACKLESGDDDDAIVYTNPCTGKGMTADQLLACEVEAPDMATVQVTVRDEVGDAS